ncbi:beta-ribofuranosylaminobenzene 5'-phosphate synthase family protein [Halobellus ordinarius]|uniref:beta-ribofuranosylaminobenzene 5'-phosphate synthase family protein n=1 Tax=Halobellus ordinarius TaxID=3075120 RepID=UPI0028804DDC|nr:beta-ribofuranosylaminobenzene 5'-phosphate synthase family protein [Halobellus sp. ZY16]
MRRARVATGGRLHFGFQNLSLAHERLYGSLGVALDEPRTVVVAEPADSVECRDTTGGETTAAIRQYTERAVEILDVPGAAVRVESALPRHVGLGSGTKLALSLLEAIGRAYGRDPDSRRLAPELGRGGRSGVGVGTFRRGGFVVDAGHPSARFTPDRPADGAWEVPAVSVRRAIPDEWRFLLVVPDVEPGRNGDDEDGSIRAVIQQADPGVADRIAGEVTRRLLPAVAEEDAVRFGAAVETIGRLNGQWYTDEQGGVYRSPVDRVVDALGDHPACYGVGQSSWGPCVYAVTDRDRAAAARDAGESALDAAGLDGEVRVVACRNDGATVDLTGISAGDPARGARND